MAVTDVSFGGQAAGTGDQRALFLKVFAGEVLTAYKKGLVLIPLVRKRTIKNGKTAQFPVTGRAASRIHTPGENLLTETGEAISNPVASSSNYLSDLRANERTIQVDDKIVSAVFIDDLDEAMSHYDFRSPFAEELGLALSYTQEKLLMRIAEKGSGAAAASPQAAGGGTELVGASSAYTTAQLVTGIYNVAQYMDENHIPMNERYIVVTPAVWWQLVQSLDILNRDYGGKGNLPEGQIVQIAGLNIVKSAILKELVDEDTSASAAFPSITGLKNDYDGSDFRNTLAIVLHKSSVGVLMLRGLSMKMEFKLEYLGHLIVASIATGHGYLRPDAIRKIEVKTTA